jgi:hypothetical protein
MKVGDRVALRLDYNRLDYARRGVVRNVYDRYGEECVQVLMENSVLRDFYTRYLILADEVHLEVRP